MNAIKCMFCRELRPLSTHLYELAEFCGYLDNVVQYNEGNNGRLVRSMVIGDWLKLASQLEKVEINTWKFSSSDDVYCGTAADRVDSDTSHFTSYSTALTRFIFVTNALEETYRFGANHYKNLADTLNIPAASRFRKASMKASALIDNTPTHLFPKHFGHLSENLSKIFDEYRKKYAEDLHGLDNTMRQTPSYSLHIVRNLRNQVAHGVFPIVDNPDYWGEEGERERLIYLLSLACRMSALFMQVIIGRFNVGFKSYEYQQIENANGPEFKYFTSNCSCEYIYKLHLKDKFGLITAFDYSTKPWNTD